MDFEDYAYILLDNELLLSFLFLLFLGFYYFVFYRKLSYNIFDAFTVELVSSAGAALGVFIMFVYGSPGGKYLFSFITCELALFGAIFLVKQLAGKSGATKVSVGSGISLTHTQKEYLQIFFYIVFIFYVLLQIVAIKLVGFILFSTDEGVNHVNAYNAYGPLFNILFIMNPVFTVCLFVKRKLFKSFTLFDYGCMAIALLSMFASGSKGSFVTFFSAFAVVDYKFAKLENVPKTKIPRIFLILLFLSIVIILSFNNVTTLSNDSAISKLFQRIALSGDCFVLGYDDSAIRYVLNGTNKTAFGYILYPLYSTFIKLVPGGNAYAPSLVGIDLYYYAFGVDDAGANGRHNFLSVLFWGPYWGWLLSFLIGGFIGYVRFYLFEKTGARNIFYLLFVCILAAIVPVCITDIYTFNSELFMLVFLFIVFLITTVILYELKNIGMAVLSHYLTKASLKKRIATASK